MNLQWQATAWNGDAVAFYEALEARSKIKMCLTLGAEGSAKPVSIRTPD